MTTAATLRFDILSYWRVGTGEGEAAGLDARCARDAQGFPVLPGKQVRGLFREAVREWGEIRPDKSGMTEALFGSRQLDDSPAYDRSQPGCLRFDDARLPVVDRQALQAHDEFIAALFRTQRSTAIERDRHVAKAHSLRLEEVAIPLTLVAQVTPLAEPIAGWSEVLRAVAPLIRSIGSGRTRGLGRVIVTVEVGK